MLAYFIIFAIIYGLLRLRGREEVQIDHYLYLFLSMMILKIVSKLHSPHMLKTTSAQHKKRRSQESNGVVLGKNPPKVKLENFFHNSRVLELGKLCVP